MEVGTQLQTPVLFLVFNRPDTTYRVFEVIRKAKPSKLFVAADGPRKNKPGEAEKCERTRDVIKMVDWPCEVRTLFREHNLGCKMAVSSAITWFFDNVEEGIILEDDCLPHETFFGFCTELLAQYRYDETIMHIGGNNFVSAAYQVKSSYYFTRYNHIWGWASWRRAWKHYDVTLKELPSYYTNGSIDTVFRNNGAKYYWLYKFLKVYAGEIDTWDYQWTYAIWKHHGKALSPAKNLVSNIGFTEDATSNLNSIGHLSNLETGSIGSIVHPQSNETDEHADRLTERLVFKLTYLKKIASFFLVKRLWKSKALHRRPTTLASGS